MLRGIRLLSGIVSVLAPVLAIAYPYVEPIRRSEFLDDMSIAIFALALITVFGFIWYTVRSDAVPSQKRALWVVVLFSVNIFALPFFWFWYVREGRPTHEQRTDNAV